MDAREPSMDSQREYTLLDELIEHGVRLAAAAAMVGDQDDLRVWRAKRNAWVQATLSALHDQRCDTGDAFRRAVSVAQPRSGWQLALPEEVTHVNGGVAVLRASTAGARMRMASVAKAASSAGATRASGVGQPPPP